MPPANPAVSDETITKVLGGYAALVHRVLTDPHRWLGLDQDPPPSAPVPLKVLDAVRDRAFGRTTPASPRWEELALKKRVSTSDAGAGLTSGGRSPAAGPGAGARRAAGAVWQLARGFRELSSMLDERPHGPLVWRALGKLPVVGLAGGWLDERGAILRASRRTAKLVRR